MSMCVVCAYVAVSVCVNTSRSSWSLSLSFSCFLLESVFLFSLSPSLHRYSPALRGARGFGFPSWVRRFLPFLISWRCFHFLLVGRTAGRRGVTSLPTWSPSVFLRAQTCSQIWSTVLRLGWSTSCIKSRYQSFWLVIGGPPPLRGSNRTGASEGRLETKEDAEGTSSKVMPSKVWLKPCSIAWHW